MRHPYLYLDGIVMKRTWAGEVRNVSLLVASAVNSEGYREILGICEGAKEDKSGWSAFLRHLVDRGLTGVRLIISDACRGLMESAAEYLPEARWQRCMVHFYRNVFSHVPTTKVREVSHMLKAKKSWLLGYSVRKDEVSAAPSFSRLFAAKELCLSLLVFGTRRSMCCRTIS